MLRRGAMVVALAVLLPATAATWAAVAVNMAGPSPEELAADIAVIDGEIAKARATLALYEPKTVIAAQVMVRIEVLLTTRAMLDQKRRSWLRGIDLTYQVEGEPVGPPDPEAFAALLADRDEALKAAEAARRKAAEYAGGLAQAIVLVEEQTTRATVAIVNQRIAMARLGFAMPPVDLADGAGDAPPVGRVVDDAGAL